MNFTSHDFQTILYIHTLNSKYLQMLQIHCTYTVSKNVHVRSTGANCWEVAADVLTVTPPTPPAPILPPPLSPTVGLEGIAMETEAGVEEEGGVVGGMGRGRKEGVRGTNGEGAEE